MTRRAWMRAVALLSALVLLCTGCSMDVEQFLRPPATRGEQQAVQQALETYIRDSGYSDSQYTLCYPVEGSYTAAFILCDAAGRPLDGGEEASLAVAFYSVGKQTSETHINLLRREEQGWVSVADTVGNTTDILQADFGDLDGDGVAELVTGWNTYNSREHYLVTFSLANNLERIAGDRLYNRLFIGKLADGDADSLVLLRVLGGMTYATLERVADSGLESGGRVWLDSDIQQFTGMTLCRLSDGVNGLYLDAIKGTDTAVTELLYVNEQGLQAPFCNQSLRINTATVRPAGFAMRDIDGDAQVEVPFCTLLDDVAVGASMPDYAYRTEWRAWDYASGSWNARMSTVTNAADGYYIVLDRLVGTWKTAYDAARRELTLSDHEEDKPLLRVRPVGETKDRNFSTLFEPSDGYAGCEVWFDSERLDIDAVRYMIVRMEG